MLPSEIRKLKRKHSAEIEKLNKSINYLKYEIGDLQNLVSHLEWEESRLKYIIKKSNNLRSTYALILLILLLQYLWSVV